MKTSIKMVLVILVMNVIAACGNDLSGTDSDLAAKEKAEQEEKDQGAKTAPSEHEPVQLRGYVASAFDMEVDGRTYLDSEDFYTQQLTILKDKAVEAGYEDYEVKFEAEVGFDDLKNDMRVYIVSMDSRGYAGDTLVNGKGQFQMSIPGDGAEKLYRIRANKRVSVLLTGPTKEKVRWCYNFSAVESSVDVAESDLPVILNVFKTTITQYACQQEPSKGLDIPNRQSGSAPAPKEPEVVKGSDVVMDALNNDAE